MDVAASSMDLLTIPDPIHSILTEVFGFMLNIIV